MSLTNAKLATNIKCQLSNLNITYTPYSHKLYKSVYIYIKYIRLHEIRKKSMLKQILIDLFDIKRLLKQKILEYPNYECFENLLDIIVATIISIVNIQYKMLFITDVQKSNYLKLVI